MDKLGILPDRAGYTVNEGSDSIFTELEGGAGRYRLDKIGAAKRLDVQWSLNRSDYAYVRAFYRTGSKLSSRAFLIDLIIDDFEAEEHTAFFIPGSFRLTDQRGHLYVVSAEIEARPLIQLEGFDELIIALFAAYGDDYAAEFDVVAGLLETFVNVTLPAI